MPMAGGQPNVKAADGITLIGEVVPNAKVVRNIYLKVIYHMFSHGPEIKET